MDNLSVGVAFAAGLVSFFSPCCLPLYPSYLSYLTGIKYQDLASGTLSDDQRAENGAGAGENAEKAAKVIEDGNAFEKSVRARVLIHSFGFVIGLSMIFFSLGFGVGLISDWFSANRDLIRQIAGLVMILMSLVLFGVVKMPSFLSGLKISWSKRPAGWLGSVLIGMGFAAGWSPCVGPILSSILALATVEQGTWLMLVSSYTLGFSLPFIGMAWWVGRMQIIYRWTPWLVKGGAGLLMLSGILLYTDQLMEWTIWYARVAPDWMKWG